MTTQQAKEILSVYRPNSADASDPEFAEAQAIARQDAGLGRWFENHCAFHGAVRDRFRAIDAPEGLKEQIISECRVRPARERSRQPVILAVAAILLLVGGLATLWWLAQNPKSENTNFEAYRDRMVRTALRTYRMDLETNDVNQIRAYLAQHQAHADFVFPAALEKITSTGCVVLSWQGNRVSMVCLRTGKPLSPDQKSDLFLFVIDRFALTASRTARAPQITRVNKLLTASWSDAKKTYVLVGPDDESLIRSYF